MTVPWAGILSWVLQGVRGCRWGPHRCAPRWGWPVEPGSRRAAGSGSRARRNTLSEYLERGVEENRTSCHLNLLIENVMLPWVFLFLWSIRFLSSPCGSVILAPSTIAWASSWSLHSRATAAAFRASQISLRPSKAGAVSQNSSRLLRSCPSVIG